MAGATLDYENPADRAARSREPVPTPPKQMSGREAAMWLGVLLAMGTAVVLGWILLLTLPKWNIGG